MGCGRMLGISRGMILCYPRVIVGRVPDPLSARISTRLPVSGRQRRLAELAMTFPNEMAVNVRNPVVEAEREGA